MRKPFDMANKYEYGSYHDDEPTIKTQVPAFLPKVIVDDDAEDDEPTLPSLRNPFHEEKRYPGIGLLIVLFSGALFWGAVLWFFVWH
jgi:hypothetical protein